MMKNTKKITAFLLAVVCVFAFAGCGKKAEEQASEKTAATPTPAVTEPSGETQTHEEASAAAEAIVQSENIAKENEKTKVTKAPEKADASKKEAAPEATKKTEAVSEDQDTELGKDPAAPVATKAPVAPAATQATETTAATKASETPANTSTSSDAMVGTYNLTQLEMDDQVMPLKGEAQLTIVLNDDGTGTYGSKGQAIAVNWVYENETVVLTSPQQQTPLTLLVRDGVLVQQGADGNAIFTK